MSTPRVLIIDDDEQTCALLRDQLAKEGFDPRTATEPRRALDRLEEDSVDVVVSDLNMREMNGLDVCEQVNERWPDVPVVLITAYGTMDSAIEALRSGAFDYLNKPFELPHLVHVVRRAAEHRALESEVKRLRAAHASAAPDHDMLGESQGLRAVFDVIRRVADTDLSALIVGESGTGKELVARALHQHSSRRDGPFVAFNCSALPSNLLESELFGHTKGAFTGATNAHAGLLVQSTGGTLFLDEIGEMAPEVQAKLLRALQERKVRPVGSAREVPFDARVLSATQRDLEADVERGGFRQDLLFRINVVRIDLPPLRARGNDVLLLAQAFVEQAAQRAGRAVTGLSSSAAEKLLAYDWPGNVRELENAMQRAVALTQYDQIVADDLPERIRAHQSTRLSLDTTDVDNLLPLEEVEKRYVLAVLEAVSGNKTAAARVLGLNRRTLYRKLDRFGPIPKPSAAVLEQPTWPA